MICEDTIDAIDEALENLFAEKANCCVTNAPFLCKVVYLQHRRNEIRLKDKEYQALPEK